MNILFLVEGRRSEKKIYKKWIPFLKNQLSYVESIQDISSNNFTIISGNGYPYYFNIIKNAFKDINVLKYNIDHIFICVDSEEDRYSVKYNEINNFIRLKCPIISSNIIIIIQHHCIETWLMGNRELDISRTTNDELITYRNHYNVNQLDPERLTTMHGELIARFTLRYLKLMFWEHGLIYSKISVNSVNNRRFLDKLIERYTIDNHIQSFGILYDSMNAITP